MQSRLTNIAGGRDDFSPAEYSEAVDASIAFLDAPQEHRTEPTAWLQYGTMLPACSAGSPTGSEPKPEIAWAELGGAPYGISVVRALSATLEDRETNDHWRPGARAMRVLVP